jgi:Pyruvate/2-oxoacid:ferredoxin oxidoreductase delta subunit
MVKREIITINEELCNGCGVCIPNCPEGALQVIDGKARLISDIYCDGLGACIGYCPQEAISTEEREAEEYDEKKVMRENIIKAGKNTIIAHLKHLKEHGEMGYLQDAMTVLKEKGIELNLEEQNGCECDHPPHTACPGTTMSVFEDDNTHNGQQSELYTFQLKQWPIQLHLVPPNAPYLQGQDVLLVADCVGYALDGFHKKFLKNKSLVIACPKLDTAQEMYLQKLTAMINEAKINTLSVLIMEVPCCHGLLRLAQNAAEKASRKIPIKLIIVSVKGEVLKEEWV